MAGTITFEWGLSDVNVTSVVFIFFVALLAGYYIALMMERREGRI